MRWIRMAGPLVALCLLGACAQPTRVDAEPRPILAEPTDDTSEPSSSITASAAPTAVPPTDDTSEPSSSIVASTAPTSVPPSPNVTTPAAPRSAAQTASASPRPPSSTGCVPQYTVIADTYARDAPGGNRIGSVSAGTHVNVRQSDGVWAYGYVGSVNGQGGRWAWMLHEKMRRTGQFCGRT